MATPWVKMMWLRCVTVVAPKEHFLFFTTS
jgi:hypothetical protein